MLRRCVADAREQPSCADQLRDLCVLCVSVSKIAPVRASRSGGLGPAGKARNASFLIFSVFMCPLAGPVTVVKKVRYVLTSCLRRRHTGPSGYENSSMLSLCISTPSPGADGRR